MVDQAQIDKYISSKLKMIEAAEPVQRFGMVNKVSGTLVEALGLKLGIGDQCILYTSDGQQSQAEVIGFSGNITYLMPYYEINGLMQGALIKPMVNSYKIRVSDDLLGRVVNAMLQPLDGKGAVIDETSEIHQSTYINPLNRKRISEPLDVGVRAINGLLTVGKGQRMGIFASSGIGKSVLIGMMTKYTSADVVVVGLVGERGREVKEFIEEVLGVDGMKKTVVVASPADESAMMRLHGASTATAIAEYFRDKGKNVLLIVDSITRYAQAAREISLSLGELPASKGYSPSVFAKMSKLIERSGNHNSESGSMTAFYTVLIDREDEFDIVGEHAKSILDGHIFLSSRLANRGHYPAIDIEKSISRVLPSIVPGAYLELINVFKQIYSNYHENHDLISMGAYKKGSDEGIDLAILAYNLLEGYLSQKHTESISFENSYKQLIKLMEKINEMRNQSK